MKEKLTPRNQALVDFIDRVYEGWDEQSISHLPDAKYMPVFGSSNKTIKIDIVVGKTLVDSWFYEKYKGTILLSSIAGYVEFSKSAFNIERTFGVKIPSKLTKSIKLHHFVRGHSNFGKYVIDHINGDPSDNRFCNLRTATMRGNACNVRKSKSAKKTKHSKYKGVYFSCKVDASGRTRNKQWRAGVTVNNKCHYKWSYTEKEAALAYNELAMKHFGEFANLNVIDD